MATPSTSSASPSSKKIGFIGLGNMGYLMARNMASRGRANFPDLPPILVWNRTDDKAKHLLGEVGQDNASIAQSPEQIANECDVIITSLANDDVVKAIYQRIAKTLRNNPPAQERVFVEMSTIYPTVTGELDTILSQIPHIHLVICPVLGTPAVADKSQLMLLMSGNHASKKLLSQLLVPAVGRKVMDLGEDLEKAPTFKLIANSLILGNIEVMAEAFTFAAKAGIDGQNVSNLITEYFPAPGMMSYADKMLHEKFDGNAGFNIDGGIKDASHIRTLTARHNCPMPIIDVAHQHLLTARALHLEREQQGQALFERLDWCGLIAGARAGAGLSGFDRSKDASVQREAQD
ncbi:NAD(P)-binding protein [Macrolepiota fuliginosa MF-IS2]|uniref:NAD(P)-binding protein n=1 Tax=Macrolepiota fuliginosa MF-IS2 TaxID=1400762 RepID=A0A9P5XI84_9AGAR|nr:NAD(P)-binding protein [Macrolepiota fuliginosa MF-IS2]